MTICLAICDNCTLALSNINFDTININIIIIIIVVVVVVVVVIILLVKEYTNVTDRQTDRRTNGWTQ